MAVVGDFEFEVHAKGGVAVRIGVFALAAGGEPGQREIDVFDSRTVLHITN